MDLSLVEQAKLSREKSREFLQQSEQMRVIVNQHKEQLKGERMKLDNIEIMLKKARTANDENNSDMEKLPQGYLFIYLFLLNGF